MHNFVLKEIITDNLEKELVNIGFDSSYANLAVDKFEYKNIKIFNLTSTQANILKQTALSVGADCATHKNVITGQIDLSDCILGGNLSQIKKISQKLEQQPFGLKDLAKALENFLNSKQNKSKTKLVGILNLTENSFSDGGKYVDYNDAIEHLHELINDGADIVDIGAESTKPYSTAVCAEKQLEKLLPILNYCKKNNINTTISIDTRSSVVAEKCLEILPCIINDVSGFDFDKKIADVAAKHNAKIIITHSKGTPEIMQNNPIYENLIDEIYLSLKNKINFAISKGIKQENIIIDVGIGFGKSREDNFEIIKRIDEFRGLECPIMLGISRKSLLNMQSDNFEKDIYTTAINTLALVKNIDYLRVHNVKMHKKLMEIFDNVW